MSLHLPTSGFGEAHFRLLLESLPAAAYTCDAAGLITYFNQQAESVWGRAPVLQDARDRYCGSFRLFTSDGRAIAHDECWMARAIKERKPFNGRELLVERPSGERLTVLAHATPFFDERGTLLGAVNVLVDISARKAAEEARQRRDAESLHAQRLESLGVLAGGIAHELNNMLMIVLGCAELAGRALRNNRAGSNALVRQHIEEIERASVRARDLVSQVLTFGRRQPPHLSALELGALTRDSLGFLRTTLPRGIEVVCSIGENVPMISGDAVHLEQVIVNLVTNAWHALGDGKGRIEVRVERVSIDRGEAQRLGDVNPGVHARLSVIDTGKGIAQELLPRIFEPFFTTKEPGKGTGLGLSVVHGIVAGHGGAIDVRSRVGVGSVFEVYFPATTETATSYTSLPAVKGSGGGQRVLVVDDEPAIVRLATQRLDALGYEADAYTQPECAMDAFRRAPERYALAMIDLNMPELSGLEVTRRLLELRPQLPVILLTGNATPYAIDHARALGLGKILQKPLSLTEFESALEDALHVA